MGPGTHRGQERGSEQNRESPHVLDMSVGTSIRLAAYFITLARATCPRALLWPPGFATGTGSKGYAFSSALTPIIAVCRQEGSAGGTSHTNEQGEDGHQQGAQAGSRFDAEFADMDDAALEEIDALTGAAQADGQAGSADGERVCKAVPPPR